MDRILLFLFSAIVIAFPIMFISLTSDYLELLKVIMIATYFVALGGFSLLNLRYMSDTFWYHKMKRVSPSSDTDHYNFKLIKSFKEFLQTFVITAVLMGGGILLGYFGIINPSITKIFYGIYFTIVWISSLFFLWNLYRK